MSFVEPIRDRKKIAQIKNLLRGQGRFRDLLLFTVGVNTALGIPDLLQLQIGHFLDDRGHHKQHFWIYEQKRNKRHEVVINQSIRETLEDIWRLILVLLKTLSTLCSSTTPRRMATLSPSNEDRPGSLSSQFVKGWDYQAISVPTAWEKPGDTLPACKGSTWPWSCTSLITRELRIRNVT